MLVLVLLAKDRAVKVVKAGLVQVWIEMRDARDVRVRLVENIVQEWEETAWSCSYVLELQLLALCQCIMALPCILTRTTDCVSPLRAQSDAVGVLGTRLRKS